MLLRRGGVCSHALIQGPFSIWSNVLANRSSSRRGANECLIDLPGIPRHLLEL